MPRSLSFVLPFAVFVLLLGTTPAAAAVPDASPFIDASTAFGLTCDEYEPDSWTCALSDDPSRYVGALIAADDLGRFHVIAERNRFDAATPVAAELDLSAFLQELVRQALGQEDAALSWLAEMNAGPAASGELVRGDWTLTWSADMLDLADPPVAHLSLELWYDPATMPAPGGTDDCPLLAAEEVEQATGMIAADSARHTTSGTVITCSFGTEPYDVQLTVADAGSATPDSLDATFETPDAEAERVPDLGQTAWWSFCSDCPYSTNFLMVLSDARLLTISFAPTTDEAGQQSGQAQAHHLRWAEELARLIVPRLSPVAATDAPAASPEPTRSAPAATPPPSAASPAPVAPIGDRASFADAVARPDQVSTDPIVLLQSAALAALLVFLMPFPGQLFNSTLEAHEDEVRRWFRLDRIGSAAAGSARFWSSWPGVAAFTLVATGLYAFLDPGFGFDPASAPTFLGMLAGIVLVTAAFAVPNWLAHRRIGDRASLKVVPISLVIGIACVLLSRLTGFQPGYLYGLLIGLAFARELSQADEGRATAIGAVVMLVVALLSWVALGALPATDNAGFGLTVLRTALAALMVAGLEGVVFGLLPLRFLPGEPLYAWNRIAWGALLAVGAFAFFHILINPASGYLSDTSRTPLFTVVALLAGFSLLSVAFWAWFRFREVAPVADPAID